MIHIPDYIMIIEFTMVPNRYLNDQINFHFMFLIFILIYLVLCIQILS